MNDDSTRENEQGRSSISNASTYEEMGEFWDTHCLTDFWGQTREVEFDVQIPRRVAVASVLYERLREEAERQHVAVETLANILLAEGLRVPNEHRVLAERREEYSVDK